MDYHPFSRSLPDLVGDFPTRPSFSSYPTTPSSPYTSRNFTPPLYTQKKEICTREEQPIAKEHQSTYDKSTYDKSTYDKSTYDKSTYNKAVSWFEGFKVSQGAYLTPFSLEDYQKPGVFKISGYDCVKLKHELNLLESDDA